jgi:leucyl aminopeptidase
MEQVAPPTVTTTTDGLLEVRDADVLAAAVTADDGQLSLGPGAEDVLEITGVDLFEVLERAKATGKAGEVSSHAVFGRPGLEQLLLVGVGAGAPADFRRAAAALARATKGRWLLASTVSSIADDAGLRAFVEGLILGSFGFHRRSTGPKEHPVARVVLAQHGSTTVDRSAAVRQGLATGQAGWLSRRLALTPSNEKSPVWLAERAREVAASNGLEYSELDERALASLGFGGILAVGKGSPRESRLIRLDYRPRGAVDAVPHVVLVGKGITFDSGGLSLKPADAMMNMKRDMTGGAAVIAAMGALRDLEVRCRVTGLVAAAENSISGTATRPGDVVRHYGGRTSEVLNTDAEGRLVLADAMAYAVDTIKPDVLVDVATLTGAVRTALGVSLGGLYSDDDALAQAIGGAGAAAGERLWRLPLVRDYRADIDSDIADARNTSRSPGGGSITAALFLQPFSGGIAWAHLDIAGVGDSAGEDFEWTTGPTGFGPRVLLYWLQGL